ncbi:ATP-binding protein [Streptomyces fractus]|uniref:ATP-binding protein n=1 Tax=Streptomyces fractus TaxID=641806 RepID=UPI003CFA64A8
MDTPVITADVSRSWQMEYRMVRGSVSVVRIHVRRHLTMWGWGGDQYEATLIASELVTNSINHGRIAGHVMLVQLALLDDGELLIDVSDPLPAFPNFDRAQLVSSEAEQGRGLDLIRELGGHLTWFLRDGVGKTTRVLLTP